MTKKDFVAIAADFATTRPRQTARAQYRLWKSLRDRVTITLSDSNPRFDFIRFIKATEQEPTNP